MAVKFWVFFSKKNTVMDHSHTTRSINKNREELVLEYNIRHRQHTQLPVTSISWNEISYRVYSITFYTGRGPRWKKKKKFCVISWPESCSTRVHTCRPPEWNGVGWLISCGLPVATSSSAFPAIYLWGSPFWVRFLHVTRFLVQR